MAWLTCLLAAAGAAGAGARQPPAIRIEARQWAQADALFHRDTRWLGSDGGYSVPLSDGRILWLFGDTFVAPTAPHVRSHGYFLRNTVAIERGADPATASMHFYWRSRDGHPSSFFPEDGTRWYWPADGIQIGRRLVVFLARVEENPRGGPGWNFQGAGWRIAIINDDSASPPRWRPRILTPPRLPAGIGAGAALARAGRYVVSLALPEDGSGGVAPGYLVRWPASDLAKGRLDRARWWAGHRGWVSAAAHHGGPVPVIGNANDGCSFTYDRKLGRWVFVRSEGFGATTIVVSFARKLEGPWSTQQFAFRPPESDRPDPNVYAAKAHGELIGAPLVVTYSTSSYPRFVKIRFSRR